MGKVTLVRRGNGWQASMHIPEKVRDYFDGKRKLTKGLGTQDKKVALRRATRLQLQWQEDLLEAETGHKNLSFVEEAHQHRKDYLSSDDPEYRSIGESEVITPRADEIGDKYGLEARKLFRDIALDKVHSSEYWINEWIREYRDTSNKDHNESINVVREFFSDKPTLDVVTRKQVKEWHTEQLHKGNSHKTITKKMSYFRHFWNYLIEGGVVPEETEFLFKGFKNRLSQNQQDKQDIQNSYGAWDDEQILLLWENAKNHKQPRMQVVADCILIAAHTGMRINEICEVKCETILTQNCFAIKDSKTKSGIRELPIHPDIQDVTQRLLENSTDG